MPRMTLDEARQAGICHRCRTRPKEHGTACLRCLEYQRQWKAKNPEKPRAYRKSWEYRNHDKLLSYWRAAYQKHHDSKLAAASARGAAHRAKLRQKVFDHYGKACVCCGEGHPVFLTLDHIDGGGRQHRASLGLKSGGYRFYQALRKQGFPPGFQTLCYNCNSAKHINGVCPHALLPE